jgi:CRP-like cAMP-binding protein
MHGHSQTTFSRNRLLGAMASEDFEILRPRLDRVSLNQRDVLEAPNEPIPYAYFLEPGLGSVVAIVGEGEKVEVGVIGPDGMSALAIVNGTDRCPHETFIQIAGEALRIEADGLREAIDKSRSLHNLLLRYSQAFSIQVAHTALVNGRYSVHERLARWLLMSHDRVDGDEIPLTHDFLALMLGVRRAGVTVALHILEGANVIRNKRGRITVLDRAELEESAGGSYGVPEKEYERLMTA